MNDDNVSLESPPPATDLRGRIRNRFGPGLKFGLSDATLYGPEGQERLATWVEWITTHVMDVVTPELAERDRVTAALREENQRLWDALNGATSGLSRAHAALSYATRYEVGPVTVNPHGDGWRCWRPDPEWPGRPDQAPTLTEDHPDQDTALARARELATGDDQ